MCQILMAAAEGPVAEFSSFANFKEKRRKSNLLISSENRQPNGFFWSNKKKFVMWASVVNSNFII